MRQLPTFLPDRRTWRGAHGNRIAIRYAVHVSLQVGAVGDYGNKLPGIDTQIIVHAVGRIGACPGTRIVGAPCRHGVFCTAVTGDHQRIAASTGIVYRIDMFFANQCRPVVGDCRHFHPGCDGYAFGDIQKGIVLDEGEIAAFVVFPAEIKRS